jgi:hypothetical protein
MIDDKRLSITTGCLNRIDYLARVLDTWLAAPEVDEIVIVDWGSLVPLRESLRRFDDPRIVIARVDGQRGWKHSKCHNLELRLATGDLVLRTDSDCLLNSGFFATHSVREGMFYAGNWRHVSNTDEAKHLTGTVYARRSDMLDVNGYNERLLHYGYEDDDFYERLVLAGLSRWDLDPSTIFHIPHPDRRRYENQEMEIDLNRLATERDERDFLQSLVSKNQVVVKRQRRWSRQDQAAPWRMNWAAGRRYVECVQAVASRSGGIRDVVFREDAGSSSEQLASVTPENKIYAHCDVVYDENFIAQIFQAMRMLHCKNQSIKDSSKENDAHLGGEKP